MDSEMAVCTWEIYLGVRVLWGATPGKGGRTPAGQPEELICDAFATEVSAHPTRCSAAGMALQ